MHYVDARNSELQPISIKLPSHVEQSDWGGIHCRILHETKKQRKTGRERDLWATQLNVQVGQAQLKQSECRLDH